MAKLSLSSAVCFGHDTVAWKDFCYSRETHCDHSCSYILHIHHLQNESIKVMEIIQSIIYLYQGFKTSSML